VGAERDGLPDQVVAQADHVAHIPIRTHSLNAAMAATVALYELAHRMRPE
jgi:TrmH family RNA methyltransferase